jgi:hypothetical protein
MKVDQNQRRRGTTFLRNPLPDPTISMTYDPHDAANCRRSVKLLPPISKKLVKRGISSGEAAA